MWSNVILFSSVFAAVCVFLSRIITCLECDTMKRTLFVNISGNITFTFDRNDIGSFLDKFFSSYFELYHLQPRRLILFMTRQGLIEYQVKEYTNRTEISESNDSVFTLTIRDARLTDGGRYSFEVPRTRMDTCFTVFILGPPIKPEINMFPPTQSVEEGSSLKLQCSSKSSTNPSNHELRLQYFWYTDGWPLPESDKRCFVDGSSLKIISIERSDSQRNISCTVKEENGLSSSSTFVPKVSWGPDLILDLNPPKSVYLLKLDNIVPEITCKADCSPDCDVIWRKAGNQSAKVYSHDRILEIGHFDVEKAGEYICLATRNGTNRVGIRTVTLKMHDEADDALQSKETETCHVTLIGSILGCLLLLSVMVIGVLLLRVYHLGNFKQTRDRGESKRNNQEGISGRCTPSDRNHTYEELDERTKDKPVYETIKTDDSFRSEGTNIAIYEN